MSSIAASTEESKISTQPEPTGESSTQSEIQTEPSAEPAAENEEPPEGFVLIAGGTFDMGSPDTEAWRGQNETRHSVTVSSFYMSPYEVTQAEI